MNNQKILIYGGSGKLGKVLSNEIKNHTLYMPSRIECDITNRIQVNDYIERIKPDVIINAAAYVGLKECEDNKAIAWNTNVIGSVNISKICILNNIRLIHISTAIIFDGINGNYKETDIPNPRSYYAITKVAAEQAVSILTNYVIVRLDFFTKDSLKYKNIYSDHYTSKISANEAAQKISRIIESDYIGIINIGNPKKSLYDILKPYYPNIKPILIRDSILPNFPKDISLNTSKWQSIFE